eukprot:SAG31_NODE_12985_length_901_cov_1.518703_1_plen_203_part_00
MRAASDQDMRCPARRGARWFAAANASVWLYRFVRARNGSETVPHGAEIPCATVFPHNRPNALCLLSSHITQCMVRFSLSHMLSSYTDVWRDLSSLAPPTGTQSDIELADKLVAYWHAFATSGDPNLPSHTAVGGQLPPWPKFDVGGRGDVTLQLDIGAGLVPLLEVDALQCDWWEKHDPCFLAGNATIADWHRADALGCGSL